MNKFWLYIWRLNPAHNWHLQVLDKMISENDDSMLLLGTPLQKSPEKNPLSFEERKDILRKIFSEKTLKIIQKNDNPKSDLWWIFDIYKKIIENFWTDIDEINFYYWAEDDSALLALKENLENFCPFNINFIKVDREQTFVEANWQKLELSATNFRKYLREGNFEIAKKFTDERIFPEIKKYFLKK